MEREDFIVNVYKKDLRYKDGERIHQVLRYDNEHEHWVNLVVDSLRRSHFTTDKYRMEVKKTWTTVRNMMTGKAVEIREEDRGTCVDPSTETYWSM